MKRIFFVALALVFLASGCILKREKPSNELLSALNIPAQACDAEDAEIGDERILGKWLVENRVAQSSGYESVDDITDSNTEHHKKRMARLLQSAESVSFFESGHCEVESKNFEWTMNSDKDKVSIKDHVAEMILDIKKLTDKELELQYGDIVVVCSKW